MRPVKLANVLNFVLRSTIVGLAAAFALILLRPDLLQRERPVVELHEDTRPVPVQHATVSYADAVARAAPSVVNVFTTKVVTRRTNPFSDDPLFKHFFGELPGARRQQLETSLGSGVILTSEGHILTNNHVIDGADEILVMLADGRRAEAKVVGTDPETDLAVLRIGLDKLPAITLGASDQLRVGDVVLAIGNPYGVGQTVTQGIVSATGRTQLGINTFEDFIQTDAAINPGNSGGALINAAGELIGVNTAIFSRTGGSQGIGFAIPVSLAKGVLQQIIEQGKVVRGWLGIETQDVTPELAESFGLKDTQGVLVAGVLRDGPADQAHLRPGDILTQIDGKRVADARSALGAIARHRPGSEIQIDGLREGKPFQASAVVTERPAAASR